MYKIMKIYYDKVTGEVVWNVSYNQDMPVDFDHDYATVKTLSERTKESMDFLILRDGQYEGDFLESNNYRVNPQTKELEFSYPNPNEPESPQVFRKPLIEEVERLKSEDLNNKEAIAELYLLSMGGF
ncbi:MAG: hypothetical protein WAM41_05150 [Psychrobacillus psychrotolerans]|uniref:hypothetical protein n=1 Tax=Psychrobacillus psychrotolerans TaxID=126156 RepID=UPI003BAED8F1